MIRDEPTTGIKRFFIVLASYAIAGPLIGHAAATAFVAMAALVIDPSSAAAFLIGLPMLLLVTIPVGVLLGLPPATICGLALGSLAAWRGTFSRIQAGTAGFAVGLLIAYVRLDIPAQGDGPISARVILFIGPSIIAALACRWIAKRFGAFGEGAARSLQRD